MPNKGSILIPLIISGVALSIFGYFFVPLITKNVYTVAQSRINNTVVVAEKDGTLKEVTSLDQEIQTIPVPITTVATHIKKPEAVKAVYISSWVASTSSIRDKIIKLVDTTELNAVVIDIKDATGKISFMVSDPYLVAFNSSENRIRDITELINMLHQKNIYVIGRIAVFQDPFMTKEKPEWAIKRKSDGLVWKDHKGLSFLDPSNKGVWDYTVAIAKDSYAHGFDEINFDYIRFPSDGNISNIAYPDSGTLTRVDVIKSFFEYLTEQLKDTGMVRSADLFGMTATNTDDLGIGQNLEVALQYFDYVSPMVYPSHFPAGWNGFKNPADHPYEVIKITMDKAVARSVALGMDPNKIRPWLQDFNLGAVYTPAMIRKQIDATYDAGLNSWMMWDASNTYTVGAFLNE